MNIRYIVRRMLGDYGSTFVSSPKKIECKTTHILRYPTTDNINLAYEFESFEKASETASYLTNAIVQAITSQKKLPEKFINCWKQELHDRYISINDYGDDDYFSAKKELAEEIYGSILEWESEKDK